MNKSGIDIACIELNPCRSIGSSVNGPMYLAVNKLIPTPLVEEFLINLPDGPIDVGVDEGKAGGAKKRAALPRMAKLIEWGIVSPGDQLKVRNFKNSDATVIDAKTVNFKGTPVRFNEWGQEVTGWSSIDIYDWAETQSGQTLTKLRAERMQKEAQEAMQQDSAPGVVTGLPPAQVVTNHDWGRVWCARRQSRATLK